MAYAYPRPQQDQRPAGAAPAPSYGKQPDGYFQYVNVPGHKEYEFGWNRGHPNHYISRYEQSKDHRFRTRVSLIFKTKTFFINVRNSKQNLIFSFFFTGSLGRFL